MNGLDFILGMFFFWWAELAILYVKLFSCLILKIESAHLWIGAYKSLHWIGCKEKMERNLEEKQLDNILKRSFPFTENIENIFLKKKRILLKTFWSKLF